MPYYGQESNYAAGDNYGGGAHYAYQAGGFLGSVGKFLGGAVRTLASSALATVTGGPLAGIRAASTALIPTFRRTVPGVTPAPFTGAPMISAVPDFDGLSQQPVGTMLAGGFIPGCQLKGTRPNKSGYYKQVVKGNPFQVVYVPKGSVCVKSRRLNVANPRALRRSIRRAQGFAKLARRVMTFVSAKPKGRAKFKRGR